VIIWSFAWSKDKRGDGPKTSVSHFEVRLLSTDSHHLFNLANNHGCGQRFDANDCTIERTNLGHLIVYTMKLALFVLWLVPVTAGASLGNILQVNRLPLFDLVLPLSHGIVLSILAK